MNTQRNLIIGSTSQIANFLPDSEFKKVNSRNFSHSDIEGKWDIAILAFGENRKNLEPYEIYKKINVDLTFETLDFLKSRCSKIIIFSTCELWNKHFGGIDLKTPMDFYETNYTRSKFEMTQRILDNEEEYSNVIILYPFNFNSTKRSKDFLFGKIFSSIINREKIEIGDTYYYRDIFHPNFIVEEILNAQEHKIIGSGRLTFVNDFIRDLFKMYGLSYEDLVEENLESFKEYEIKYEYYLKSKLPLYSYSRLIEDTSKDINKKIDEKKNSTNNRD
jgi:GDP-D-mannose dehydratase